MNEGYIKRYGEHGGYANQIKKLYNVDISKIGLNTLAGQIFYKVFVSDEDFIRSDGFINTEVLDAYLMRIGEIFGFTVPECMNAEFAAL
ncbi:MAG: hypothetical protein LBJ93_03430, partial [Clostridiales bacterium]|nr:hypothetical protein [Clostridiales bacterium]